MRSRLLVVLALIIHAYTLCAEDYRFVRLNVLNGFSSDNTKAIFTDHRGFVWVGTSAGLNCFDGKKVTTYLHRNSDSTSIPNDEIRTILEDPSGELWVGTAGGVVLFNPWNGKAKRIQQVEKGFPPCESVYIDRAGVVWAWAIGSLWKYNPTDHQFHLFLKTGKDNSIVTTIRSVYEDREHRFWVCTLQGLYLLDRKTKQTIWYKFSDDRRVSIINAVYEDTLGNFWCATWGSGIVQFDRTTGIFSSWQWNPNSPNPSATNIVFSITETFGPEGKLWAATNNGLAVWKKDSPVSAYIQFLQHDPINPESISDNQVNCVSSTRENQVWAGTAGGVAVVLPEFQIFQSFSPSFSGETMRCVDDVNGGHLICTWYGNGLQRVDATGTIQRVWKRVPEDGDVNAGQVSDACRDANGNLWIATFGGLAQGDTEGKTFTLLKPGDSTAICDSRITCVARDSAGFIWAGSYGKGISRVNPKTKQCKNFNKANNNLAYDLCWGIFCAADGAVWIGTDDGVSRIDPVTGKFKNWFSATKGHDTIRASVCTSFYEDQAHNMWFTSVNGLFKISSTGEISILTRDDGLSGNAVMAVRQDREHNFWISTSTGLTKFNSTTQTYTSYSINNGLPVSSLEGDMSTTVDGKLILSLHNLLLMFDPEKLNQQSSVPDLFITEISIAGKVLEFDHDPVLENSHQLSWTENILSFDFVSPGLHGGPNMRYAYRLLGADEHWIVSGDRHFASFANLPSGTYTFECRASYANGEWGVSKKWSFTITPPFWKTWWFITLITALVLFTIIFMVWRESTRKIRERLLVLEKEQAIQKERNRISRDMHDDLGSGLTKIAILSEVAKKKMDKPDEAQKQIDTISDSARNLVDNLNEIIWALNPENDNIRNLIAYTREYADKYLEPFHIRLECELPDDLAELHLSEEKRRFIFLVVKESLHNIVKHAQATVVRLHVETKANDLFIHLEDNGQGFEMNTDLQAKKRTMGNGLKNMQRRIASIGGDFRIESTVGAGTHTYIHIRGDA